MKSSILVLAALALSGCGLSDYINTSRAYNYMYLPHFASGPDSAKIFDAAVPGIGVGSEAPTTVENISVGVEAGYYRDPVRDESLFALAFAERDMFPQEKPRGLRVGVYGGITEFVPPEEDGWLTDDITLTGGVQATMTTVGRHEVRLRIGPGFGESELSFLIGSTIKF